MQSIPSTLLVWRKTSPISTPILLVSGGPEWSCGGWTMFWFGKVGSDVHALIPEISPTPLAWGTEAVDTSWRGLLGCRLCLWRTTQKHAFFVCMVCGKQRTDQQGEHPG